MPVYRQVYTPFHQYRPKVLVGVDFAPEPPPVVAPPRASKLPTPRTTAGRTVRLQLTANLGRLTAQTGLRIELADEELIELL